MLNQANPEEEVEAIAKAFPPDSLHRDADKSRIKRWIEIRKKGVLAINGRWGSGKTWLSDTLLKDYKREENYIGVKIDAFSADWSDEPELTIFSQIFASDGFKEIKNHEKIRGDIRKGLIKYTGIAVKIGIQALSSKFLGPDFDIKKLVNNSDIDTLIDESLKGAKNKEDGLKAIHKAIKSLCDSGKKIVILVDELDRCSPPFAVKLLEKVKHLFDVDGVIVILFWNEEQMRDSLSHFYGKASASYFQKFVHATHNLYPKSYLNGSKAEVKQVIKSYFEEFYRAETSFSKDLESSLVTIVAISDILNLNARESHRYVDLVACWNDRRVRSHSMPNRFLEWLLAALFVKNIDLIKSLKDGKVDAKKELLDELSKIALDDLQSYPLFEGDINFLKALLSLKQGEVLSEEKLPRGTEDLPFQSALPIKNINGEIFSGVLQSVAVSLFVV